MKLAAFLFLTLSFSSSSFALSVEEAVKKMQENFVNANRVEYNSTYELLKGHKSSAVHSSYDGYVYRDGKQVYQKIKNTEFVYTKDYFLKISNEESALVLDVTQKNIQTEIAFETVLESCSSKTIEDKGDYYAISLNYSDNASNAFSVVKMRIAKKTFELQQLDMYYRVAQDFSTTSNSSDLAKPHLRIKFSNINLNAPEKEELFKFSNYISKNNSLLSPTGKYSKHSLIDNRIK